MKHIHAPIQKNLGSIAKFPLPAFGIAKKCWSRDLERCYLTLPHNRVVAFDHPPKFHLPRHLNGKGIQHYEPVSQAAFLAVVEQSNGVVFDIGANIGVYSMVVSTALRRPVYAYEPFAEACNVLRSIVAAYNFPIHVTEAAIASTAGTETFYVSRKSDMSNSLNPGFREHAAVREVRSLSIDSESARVRPCAIKIDTESTEMDVLNGAKETLKRDRPALLVEVLSDALADQVRAFVEPFGYTVYDLGKGPLREALGDVSDLDTDGDKRNWLILPDESPVNEQLLARMRFWLDHLRNLPVS